MTQSQDHNAPVDFSSFVISLASSAMVHLGEVPDPATQSTTVDLKLARHSIDLLGVLEDKTQGNLDDEEAKLLETVLYDLRMKFVDKRKQHEGEAATS